MEFAANPLDNKTSDVNNDYHRFSLGGKTFIGKVFRFDNGFVSYGFAIHMTLLSFEQCANLIDILVDGV